MFSYLKYFKSDSHLTTPVQDTLQTKNTKQQHHILSEVKAIQFYLDDFGDALFLLEDAGCSRCFFGDCEAAALRLRLRAGAAAADFLRLEAGDMADFAGDFAAVDDLAAGDWTLPRVTRFSEAGGVFDTDRLELRGIVK